LYPAYERSTEVEPKSPVYNDPQAFELLLVVLGQFHQAFLYMVELNLLQTGEA